MSKVKLRKFYLELKHRPADDTTGENERLISTLELTVPRLANSDMEVKWARLSAWNLLNSDYAKQHDINQIFLFTADCRELIIRLELNKFVDEKCQLLTPPDSKEHEAWTHKVQKKFTQLYGVKMAEWMRNNSHSKTSKFDFN